MGQRRGGFVRAGFRRAGTGGGGSGGLSAVVSGSPFLGVTTAAGIATVTQNIIADWTLGICRIYAVDGVNGNDANVGFSTPASNSAADYAIACADAGTKAKKTLAGLAAIFPRVGAGRKVEIVIANGGVNTVGTYTDTLTMVLGGVTGYDTGCPTVRGTGTNSTFGIVAFDGSAADVAYMGNIPATGTNATGYNPIGAPTTTVMQVQKVGGAAAAFGAEPAVPLGLRVHFSATTPTVALRGVIGTICKVAGTDTLTFPATLGAVPATVASGNPDVFFIESPGVSVPSFNLGGNASLPTAGVQIAGIQAATMSFQDAKVGIANCTTTTTFIGNALDFTANRNYVHPVRGTINCAGSRIGSSMALTNCRSVTISGVTTVTTLTVTSPGAMQLLAGTVCGTNLFVTNARLSTSTASVGSTGAPGSILPRAIVNFNVVGGCQLAVGQLDTPTFQVFLGSNDGQEIGTVLNLAVAGANCSIIGTAPGGAGFQVADAINTTVLLGATLPTITGPAGDILGAQVIGSQFFSWATAAAGFSDGVGNEFRRAYAISSTGVLKYSGILFGGAGATFTYLADGGDALAVNNVVPMNTPFYGHTLITLDVKPRVNTMAAATTATVYVNGAISAPVCQVSIPAGSVAIASQALAPLSFPPGSTIDLRLDNAGDATHVCSVSATIGYM